MSLLDRNIYLAQTEQDNLRKLFDEKKISSVTDFLANAAEKLEEGKDWAESLAAAAPWMKEAAAEFGKALPVVGAIAKVVAKWLEPNFKELAAIACTMAYQAAVRDALAAEKSFSVDQFRAKQKIDVKVRRQIRNASPAEQADLGTFTLDDANNHIFVRRADRALEIALDSIGYDATQQANIFNQVHDGFVEKLKSLLYDSKTKDKFEPLKSFFELGNAEKLAHVALATHAEYQREQYEAAPVFRFEPFALKNVYVETECGVLDWQQIKKHLDRRQLHGEEMPDRDFSPFDEKYGGRENLVETVMGFIRDPAFNEPIVLQGEAGAGKSSFTIRLSAELLKEGFCPIRIRLKKLRLGQPLIEALPDAIELGDEDRLAKIPLSKPRDMLLGGRIFDERYGATNLCRYVLILDGWDELSLAADKSFRENVQEMLRQVRDEFWSGKYSAQVRVVVTGRPSDDVGADKYFLRAETKVLTLRRMKPGQLRQLVAALKTALETQPVHAETEATWQIPDLAKFEPVFKDYEQAFAKKQSTRLEVLGSPLLAYLAIRVMAESEGDLTELINQPTRLYRELTDLTCGGAGKYVKDLRDTPGERDVWWRTEQPRLRQLLQRTAAAMTVNGKEYISKDQLIRRVFDDGETVEADEVIAQAERESALSKLMVSFFFKGGHPEMGCEFSHKSFREYLAAECIIATLKEFGRRSDGFNFARRPKPERDFLSNGDDPRYDFSRRLSELLAPQWLKPEVIGHLEELLRWEIQRSRYGANRCGTGSVSDLNLPLDAPTETQVAHAPRTASPSTITFRQWEQIRDGLADLWEWWVDGAHLRPQWIRSGSGRSARTEIAAPYVQELIEWSAPLDVARQDTNVVFESATTLDAHLGDGLCQIAAMVHFFVAISNGWKWPEARRYQLSKPAGKSKYQQKVSVEQGELTLFAPIGIEESSRSGVSINNLIARIKGAADRPQGEYPQDAFLQGTSFVGANLADASFVGANLTYTLLHHSDLVSANLEYATLNYAVFGNAFLGGANLYAASLRSASLLGSQLNGTNLAEAWLDGASLDGALGLTWEQINSAWIDEWTSLPPEFEELRKQKLARQQADSKDDLIESEDDAEDADAEPEE